MSVGEITALITAVGGLGGVLTALVALLKWWKPGGLADAPDTADGGKQKAKSDTGPQKPPPPPTCSMRWVLPGGATLDDHGDERRVACRPMAAILVRTVPHKSSPPPPPLKLA